MAFIDDHRERFGVEPICRALTEHGCKIAPNTYWSFKKRPLSKRAARDTELKIEIKPVYDTDVFVYGAAKIWTQLNDEGIKVARCIVERLMREMGLVGNRRRKAWTVTTDSYHGFDRPAHLVDRLGLRRVRDRRVPPHGRRPASLHVAALWSRWRGPGDRSTGYGSCWLVHPSRASAGVSPSREPCRR